MQLKVLLFIDSTLYCVIAGQDFIRCWRTGLFLEDNVLGGQHFAGGCSELYICLHKSDGVVHACAVCVTGRVKKKKIGGGGGGCRLA